MVDEEELARLVSGELDGLTAGAPPVGFTAADVLAAGRARRRSRRLGLAAGGSVAASLAATVAVLVASLAGGGGGPVPVAGPPAGGTAPGVTTTAPAAPRPSTPFGLSKEEAGVAAKECGIWYSRGRSVSLPATASPPAGPAVTVDRVGTEAALSSTAVYNAARDDAGMVVLLYGPNLAMICAQDRRGQVVHSDVTWQWAVPKLMTGPVTIDVQEAYFTKVGTDLGFDVIAGRVSRGVAHVQVDLDGHAAEVEPVNGTYVVRFPRSVGEYRGQPPAWVRGIDADGHVIGASTGMAYECLLAAGGSKATVSRACRPGQVWAY